MATIFRELSDHPSYVLFCVTFCLSSFAIILMEKRELVALLDLSSWCLVINCCMALPRGAIGLSTICDRVIP